MLFIKVSSNHTEADLEKILQNAEPIIVGTVRNLYNSFNYVEYTNHGFEEMYAVASEHEKDQLIKLYEFFGMNFRIEDISKEILFGYEPEIDDIQKGEHLKILTKEFVLTHLGIDIVLDKILEKGLDSLTNYDFEVLKRT